jgi:hypothetical protein
LNFKKYSPHSGRLPCPVISSLALFSFGLPIPTRTPFSLSHFPSPSAHLGIFSAAVKRQSKIHELSGGKPLLNFLLGQLTAFFSLRRRKIFAFHGLLGRLTELYVECRAFFNGKPNQNN